MSAPSLDELLQQHFGFSQFRPGQREVLGALRAHQCALAVFPTGAGKSLCYQLAAIALPGVTVVVSPLIALMKDQLDFLQKHGVDAARLDSSLGADEAAAVTARLRAGTLKLLFVAPERFNNERFLALLKGVRISLFAVDEAHCISEWGHNFRPDYLKLAQLARDLKVERILALTATATPAVVESICRGFEIPKDAVVVTGFYRPNLTMLTTPVAAERRDAVLAERLRERPAGPTIVYVTLQKTAERVAENLHRAGFAARPYHAGMETDERTAVQDWWMASTDHVVVATIAFGMGIDKANVRYVYHYNLPKSLESYSQEIGRAGRDGAPSTVEVLACADDVPVLENFAYGDTPAESALQSLVDAVLGAGETFDVSLYELSGRHDLKPLVLKTALTYLELCGALKQGTPYYAGYEVQPRGPLDALLGHFDGERREFLAQAFAQAKKGRLWFAFETDRVALALGQPRARLTRALEYLDEKGLAMVRASDARQRYARVRPDEDGSALVAMLAARFRTREEQEIARLEQVLRLCEHDGCQVNALVGHFGEVRSSPCGHCGFCQSGRAQPRLRCAAAAPVDAALDGDAARALARQHPAALAQPRQLARFFCALASPATTRAKLNRHALWGALEGRRFADVLAWCEALKA